MSKPVLGRILRDDHRRQDHRDVIAGLARQELLAGRELPEIGLAAARDGAAHAAGSAVVGRHREVPVFEDPVQRLEVLGGGLRGLLRVGALVEIPVGLQAVLERRAAHELPHAARLRARQRRRLERAFDQRDVRQVQRQPFGPERGLDHRQVLRAARQTLGQEFAQPALEQLDVAQHAVVGRDRNVVARGFEVRLHRLGRGGLRRAGFEGLDLEQRIDRRRLGLDLGKAVAGGQRRLLEHRDAIDQAVEVLAQPRVSAGAARRFEQRIEGEVELDPGAHEVAQPQLLLAQREMVVGRRDQNRDRIRSCLRNSGGQHNRRRRVRGRLGDLAARAGCASCNQPGIRTRGRRGGVGFGASEQ